MAGGEQESSLPSVELRVSAKYMLFQPLNRNIGRPGESLELLQLDDYGGRVLQIVLQAASVFFMTGCVSFEK